ncbi:hypothetical protein INT43_003210 [Umbelopsis isabellina]|uniref:Uncharacterized protein n=1 Tax=Mortierella isabellina TaxID=91625 RepID=A0A8H7PPV2_MORIS|nr:hypothetical protein INT43_003210 [Umbelopsis isabellina]
MLGTDSPTRLLPHSEYNVENTAPRTTDSYSQSFYSPISPLDKLGASKRLSSMKRLSSPNLWRIRDSQPLQTVQNASFTNDNDENDKNDSIRPEHLPHLESPLAKDDKLYVSKEIDHHEIDEAPKLLDNKHTVNNAEGRVVNSKPKAAKKPMPSYMRFTEAYKRSKGLIADEEEERELHHYRSADNFNKRTGHNTKALLGPKSAAGISVRVLKNKKHTVPQPFHFHSSLRAHVVQESSDNQKDGDEPFVSLALRIKQFEENIAGRGYEHGVKDKELKHDSEIITTRHIVPRSPRLLTKIRHSQGHHHSHEAHDNTEKVSQKPAGRAGSSGLTADRDRKLARSAQYIATKPPILHTALRASHATSRADAEMGKSVDTQRKPNASVLKRKRQQDASQDEHHKRQRRDATTKKQPAAFVPTVPQPFSFQTDLRGQHYQDQFMEKLEMWRQRDNGSHDIHAKPAPHYPPPIAIKRSVKPLTAAQEVVLHSEIRALERKTTEDDKKLKAKLAALEHESSNRSRHV